MVHHCIPRVKGHVTVCAWTESLSVQCDIFPYQHIELAGTRQEWECIESNLHGYQSIHYKLIRQNIDNGSPNKDKTFWWNLVIWGKCYGVIYGWQADFRNVTRGT
jgi:hypothetical protein